MAFLEAYEKDRYATVRAWEKNDWTVLDEAIENVDHPDALARLLLLRLNESPPPINRLLETLQTVPDRFGEFCYPDDEIDVDSIDPPGLICLPGNCNTPQVLRALYRIHGSRAPCARRFTAILLAALTGPRLIASKLKLIISIACEALEQAVEGDRLSACDLKFATMAFNVSCIEAHNRYPRTWDRFLPDLRECLEKAGLVRKLSLAFDSVEGNRSLRLWLNKALTVLCAGINDDVAGPYHCSLCPMTVAPWRIILTTEES